MKIKIDKSDWVKVRLGDVAYEYSKRINNPSESEYERFVGSSNIGQWDFRVKSWESTSSVTSAMKLFEPNDYLLVRRSLYASDFRERAPRAHFHGVCSGDILTLKENPKYIHDGFLVGILNSPDLWKYVVANGSGSITRRIHWKDLANYEFLLPPKDQQKQFAELLWAGDDLIAKESEVLEKLNRLKSSSLINFFQHPVCIDDYSSQDLLLTSVGWIPKTWEVVEQQEVAEFVNGRAYKKEEWEDLGTPVIRLQNLTGSGEEFYYSNLDLPEKNYCHKGDLLYMWSATFGARIWTGDKAIFHYHIWNVKCNEERLNKMFMFYNLEEITRRMMKQVSGSTMPHITKAGMDKLQIALPPLEHQNEVVQYLNNITSRLEKAQIQINNTKLLLKSIINQIF